MLGEEGHRVQSEDSREGHLLFESRHSMGMGVFMVREGGREGGREGRRERERERESNDECRRQGSLGVLPAEVVHWWTSIGYGRKHLQWRSPKAQLTSSLAEISICLVPLTGL